MYFVSASADALASASIIFSIDLVCLRPLCQTDRHFARASFPARSAPILVSPAASLLTQVCPQHNLSCTSSVKATTVLTSSVWSSSRLMASPFRSSVSLMIPHWAISSSIMRSSSMLCESDVTYFFRKLRPLLSTYTRSPVASSMPSNRIV